MEVWLTCQHITNVLTVVDKPYMEIWVIIACHVEKSSYHLQVELFSYHQINLANGARVKMPLKPKYQKIYKQMIKEYGPKRGRAVFYATANKNKWKYD
jgi:hypothetical protein